MLGVPDQARGEIVAALILPQEGLTLDPQEIPQLARKDLSNFKVPRYVVIGTEDELPWLATGKPDQQAIKQLLVDQKPSATGVE